MRIISLILVLLLSACASGEPTASAPLGSRGDGSAQAYCLSKGYVRGSFDFDSCYRNRPEVQAGERAARLQTLGIIAQNKSPRSGNSRSYPVE